MRNFAELAQAVRGVMACSRVTKRYREDLADVAADLDELAENDSTDELEAMVVSLHEQAHGQTPIRLCTEAPCCTSNVELARGPAQWAFL